MADVLVIDVADDIRLRLGEPTVAALARRFGAAGRCLTCGERLGAAPLSVRAYRDHAGIITLMAYHAGCAASAWVDVGPGTLPRRETWAAAVASVSLPLAARRWSRWLRGPGPRDQVMPVMLVHPSLEMTRVRQAGFGEAVNADIERYGRLGFADTGAFARACPLRPAGRAWLEAARGTLRLQVTVADRAWSAPIPPPAAALAVARGGVLVGVACDRDPGRLAAEASYLRYTVANGDVLLGWAPLPGGHGGDRHPGRPR
ncbi:MAG TPA: hypothetical protein VH642_13985 [Streptosporangiaceae bacterium]